jgi:pSer/pThr/pTyr-binding forkhead associated (FHA) protein
MKIHTIGRKGADIVLDDESISRRHAELTVTDDGRYYLVDCGSSNGTELRTGNGWKAIRQEFVQPEDEVRFAGREVMTVRELVRRGRSQ